MMSGEKKIYFIKPVGMDGPIKIGCSKFTEDRLATLSRWSPFPLEVICQTAGNHTDEFSVHRKFSHLRQHMEWFSAGDDLVEFIEKVRAGASINDVVESEHKRQRRVFGEKKTTDGCVDVEHETPNSPASLIIDKLGGLTKTARLLSNGGNDFAVSTVQGWKERGYIPQRYWASLIKEAKEGGVELTVEMFIGLKEDAA